MKPKNSTNRIEEDSRREADAEDFEQARAESSGLENFSGADETELIAEEDRPGNGVPPGSTEKQIPKRDLDDEGLIAETEVEEGVAEADLDTRARSRHAG